MRRVSILGMMGLILALAVILAALRDANDYWASGLYIATACSIGVAAVWAAQREGKVRAANIGFAIFAGGYFSLAFFVASEAHLGRLPTTWLMSYIHRHVSPWQLANIRFGTTANPPTGPYFTVVPPPLGPAPDEESVNRWRSLFPGAANPIAFATVGHCLFALLSGLIGIFIALRTRSTAERPKSASD